MLGTTILFAVLAAALLAYGYSRGQGEHIEGLKRTGRMLIEIMPLILGAFIVASMVQILLPREVIVRWAGEGSGLKGLLISAGAGALTPGGPFVVFPLAVGFMRSGASLGPVVAYLTGWALWGLTRLPLEIGILGWRLTLVRLATTVVFPPVAGLLAHALFRRFVPVP